MTTQHEQIYISPVLTGAGKFDHWNMNYNGGNFGPGAYPPIAVLSGNNADFTVTIKDAPKITFSTDPILYGPVAPTKPIGKDGNQIHSISGANTSVLTFKDHNSKKGDIAYVFNFNNAPQLDPVIGNNGGGPPLSREFTWYAVGAIALLAIVLLAFRLMQKRSG